LRSLGADRDPGRWRGARGSGTLAGVAGSDAELSSHPAEAKAALRREILARRDAIDPTARAGRSAAATARVAALGAFREARVAFAYASFGSELDTRPLLRRVLAGGRDLVLPRVERAARRLALHQVRDLDADLEPGTWGIPEPASDRCRQVAPSEIDFILVPGVVFDPDGGRIGYGAGYYDRLLAAWPCPVPPLVAAAFELQVVPRVPVGPTDHRVDLVVTEASTYVRLGLPYAPENQEER
jgi:5-formyltetrahydrofolate cyclo-ligase